MLLKQFFGPLPQILTNSDEKLTHTHTHSLLHKTLVLWAVFRRQYSIVLQPAGRTKAKQCLWVTLQYRHCRLMLLQPLSVTVARETRQINSKSMTRDETSVSDQWTARC